MSLEENKTVVRRLLEEAIAQGNLDVIDTTFAPHFALHMSNTPLHNRASFRAFMLQFHQAMSGHSLTIHDLIAEGDTVAARFSYAAAAHSSQWGKNPPTGQPFQFDGTLFLNFEQGKVTEMWASYEGASFDISGFGE